MEAKFASILGKYVSKGRVFVFSKSTCPYCDQAKDLLNHLEVKHGSLELDINKPNDFSDDFIKYLNKNAGIRTYPK